MKHFISKILSKIFRVSRRLTRNYILLIIYYVMLPIIALCGSKIDLKKPSGNSFWRDWDEDVQSKLVLKQTGKWWVVSYVSWCYKSKNIWMLFLLQFILILKTTENSSETPTLESSLMYTLF